MVRWYSGNLTDEFYLDGGLAGRIGHKKDRLGRRALLNKKGLGHVERETADQGIVMHLKGGYSL